MNQELEKLKTHLPKGYTKILAEEFNVSPMTIHNSLSGKTKRYDIIQRAVAMAKEKLETIKDAGDVVGELEKKRN